MSIELLGGFRVHVGGRSLGTTAWPGRRSAELVQLLALAERRTLLGDQVIDALWPHLDPAAGAANLRKAAHHCRHALGRDDAVVLAGGRVTLLPDADVVTDVEGFEAAADSALRSGDGPAAAEAAARCTGVLLPGSLNEEWTQSRRERIRARRAEVLRLAQPWEELAEAEPADEQAHQELVRASLREDNRHAAIRWYGRLRTRLERELGLTPGPDSRALHEECVAGLSPAATPFFGRQVELARAAVALRSAERGASGALVLRGPRASASRRRAARSGWSPATGAGRCWPSGPRRAAPRTRPWSRQWSCCSVVSGACSTGCRRRCAPPWLS